MLEQLLKDSQKFCASAQQADEITELFKIMERNTFRICITGGFSRGKSHFINTLLGVNLLPESALPTTTHVTILQYGEKPEIVIEKNGKDEVLPLTSENLAKYSALEDDANVDAPIKIKCPLPLLQNGLEIIDTPGVDDGFSEGSRLTCEALLNADAAIIMLSAISPLSLTEKEFIKVYLLDRAIPLLACGISFLDKIPASNRASQLSYLIKRASGLYPHLEFLIPQAENIDEKNIVCGKNEIEQFINNWRNLPDLNDLRQKMVLKRLIEILKTAIQSVAAQKKLLDSDLAETRAKLSQAITALSNEAPDCLDLKIRFTERLDNLMDNIRSNIANFSEQMVEESKGTGFDSEQFSTDFLNLYSKLTQEAGQYLAKDAKALAEALEERFGVPVDIALFNNFSFGQLPVTKIQPHTKFPNEFFENAVRKGLEFGDIFSVRIPMGPILWPMLKPRIKEGAENLRKLLEELLQDNSALKTEILSNTNHMSKVLRTQLEEIYKSFFDKARKSSQDWLENQKQELMKIHNPAILAERQHQVEELLLTGYALRDKAEAMLNN